VQLNACWSLHSVIHSNLRALAHLQHRIHAMRHALHCLRDCIHPERRIHARCNSFNSGGHPKLLQGLVLGPDSVHGMDFGDFNLLLLDCFLHLLFLLLLILLKPLAHPLHLRGGDKWVFISWQGLGSGGSFRRISVPSAQAITTLITHRFCGKLHVKQSSCDPAPNQATWTKEMRRDWRSGLWETAMNWSAWDTRRHLAAAYEEV